MKRLSVLLVVALTVCLASLSLFLSATTAQATDAVSSGSGVLPGAANGSAYAGFLKVPAGSSVAKVGPLFPVGLGCSTTSQTVTSTAGSMHLNSFASSGSLVDKVVATRTSTTAKIEASSDVQSANVLTGLITADEVHTIVDSQATATSASSSNNSTFTNLVVAGNSISGTPAPNTRIDLAGLGFVILNEQSGPVNHANSTHISVTAIDVNVTLSNSFGLPVGTHILIAHAESGFKRTSFPAVVSAKAYGLLAFAKAGSGFAKSGPWALAAIGCTGGNKTVSVASVHVPNVGDTGTVTDTASGHITSSGPTASSSSTVQKVNLLGGIVVADAVSSSAQASFTNGSGSASATTTLVNAVINGNSISANPPPNTKITISGLGYVIVNEQSTSTSSTGASATVDALDIHITMSNSLGLPVGLRIIVGHSDAKVKTF